MSSILQSGAVSWIPSGRVVGRRSRSTVSEAKGNEKVLVDVPSRNVLFTFKKPFSGAVGWARVSLEGE